MNEFLFVFTDYLKGNPTYPVIRRALNFVFNTFIAGFIYEKIIGSYHWIEISEYKLILDFLMRGNFVIPLCLYALVYAVTDFLFYVSFKFWLDIKILNAKLEYLKLELDRESFIESFDDFVNWSKKIKVLNFTKENISSFYNLYVKNIPVENIKIVQEQNKNIAMQFVLIIRMILVSVISYFNVSNFPTVLFLIILSLLIFSVFALTKAYKTLAMLPELHDYFNKQFEKEIAT